jgi:hypothetical protein
MWVHPSSAARSATARWFEMVNEVGQCQILVIDDVSTPIICCLIRHCSLIWNDQRSWTMPDPSDSWCGCTRHLLLDLPLINEVGLRRILDDVGCLKKQFFSNMSKMEIWGFNCMECGTWANEEVWLIPSWTHSSWERATLFWQCVGSLGAMVSC